MCVSRGHEGSGGAWLGRGGGSTPVQGAGRPEPRWGRRVMAAKALAHGGRLGHPAVADLSTDRTVLAIVGCHTHSQGSDGDQLQGAGTPGDGRRRKGMRRPTTVSVISPRKRCPARQKQTVKAAQQKARSGAFAGRVC